MSRLGDWIYKKTNKYPCALPESLRNYKGTGKVRLHDDWPPPLNKIPRSFNAKGPRCEGENCPNPWHIKNAQMTWPPKLVGESKGISRWENAGASSRLYIPSLDNKIITPDFYGTKIRAWETNPASPQYRKELWIHITWEAGQLGPHMYSPSALQRWSPVGYLRMEPTYWSWWKVIKKNEDPFKDTIVTKENKVLFFRNGWRNDSLDIYYNKGPMIGLQMD